MKINILFLGYSKNQGLTYHLVDWIKSLDKLIPNNMKITLLTLKEEQNPGLHKKLQELQSIPVMVMDKEEDFEQLNVFSEVDIVHCQGFSQVRKILQIKKERKLNFSIVITINWFGNDYWYKYFYTNLSSMLYSKKINIVHFLSQMAKNEFLKYNIFYNRATQSYVFPLGCSKEEFSQVQDIQSLEFYDELCKSKKNVIYLANFSPGKQHMWLINTIKDVLIQENAKLWLFGEGPAREKLIKYVQRNNLSQYVKLPGRIDRIFIPAILEKMNLAVCTSKSENSPHAIMEPMFAGIPVVTFDVGTASYLIRDFTTGFIIRNKTEQENFKRAVKLLLEDSAFAEKLGQNAKTIANQWLTWDVVSKNTIDMYFTLSERIHIHDYKV